MATLHSFELNETRALESKFMWTNRIYPQFLLNTPKQYSTPIGIIGLSSLPHSFHRYTNPVQYFR